MEKLDLDQLDGVSGGVGIYKEHQVEFCYLCGAKSNSKFGKGFFGLGFSSVFDKDGEHRLCPFCYAKWCDEKSKKL